MSTVAISAPFAITPRLQAGIHIGDAWLSLGYAKRCGDENRTRYRWWLDLDTGESFTDDDMQSGNCGTREERGLQRAFGTLLAFLGAAAESLAYQERTGREGENVDLFPLPVLEWARQHDNELSSLACDLEQDGASYIVG